VENPVARFKDNGKSLVSFGRDLLVNCPRCRRCARLHFADARSPMERAIVCVHCGYSEKNHVKALPAYSYRSDWHRRLDLWLQVPCGVHVLWALNEEHLSFLEGYVSAKIRERRPSEFGWSNQSLAGRLPRWLTAAKSRDNVTRGLERLREKL
jgi:hypothetical protein